MNHLCGFSRFFLMPFIVLSLLFYMVAPYSFASEESLSAEKAELMYEEGLRLLSDSTDAQNLAKGIALILTSAKLGSAKAMVQVGMMYSSGLGRLLSEDFVEGSEADLALDWYLKAAEAGEKDLAASAITSDAFSYFLGSEDNSIKEDDAVALKYFEKAAELGDPRALNMMVAFYIYGFGVQQDPDKALELEVQLASRGDKEALVSMEEYAYAYYAGNKDGIDINFSTSFKFYKQLAEFGNERAMYNVGLLYEYGLGVSVDHNEAINWFTKAKEAGYDQADTVLSELQKGTNQ